MVVIPDTATRLGKEVAKRATSHSRTFKLNSDEELKSRSKAIRYSSGNVQPPYRYGRRIKRAK